MPDKFRHKIIHQSSAYMITQTKNMENQSRIEELLSDALRKYDQMLEKHDETNRRLTNVEGHLGRLENLEEKLSNVEGKLGKLENLEQKLGSLDQKLGGVDQKLGSLDQKLGNVEMKLERLDGRLGTLQMKVEISNQRLGNVEGQFQKLNLQTAENTRAIIRLGDELQRVFEHEKRIDKLELTVYK